MFQLREASVANDIYLKSKREIISKHEDQLQKEVNLIVKTVQDEPKKEKTPRTVQKYKSNDDKIEIPVQKPSYDVAKMIREVQNDESSDDDDIQCEQNFEESDDEIVPPVLSNPDSKSCRIA